MYVGLISLVLLWFDCFCCLFMICWFYFVVRYYCLFSFVCFYFVICYACEFINSVVIVAS